MRRILLPAAVPLAAVLVGALLGTIHGAEAQRGTRRAPSIAVGQTSAPDVVEHTLRAALNEQLGGFDSMRLTSPSNARFVVRAAVTRLDVQRDGERNEIECEVSVFVEERGSVRMVLSGRAAARGSHVERLRHSAVRAAVRGALRSLPSNLH